jgi:hypothetical protein
MPVTKSTKTENKKLKPGWKRGKATMNVSTTSPAKACRRRKFTDEKLVELHSHGLGIPKLATQLGVPPQPVRCRMEKLGK